MVTPAGSDHAAASDQNFSLPGHSKTTTTTPRQNKDTNLMDRRLPEIRDV
jgi:hypothetical protein